MIGDRQQVASMQSDFYRDCYYRMIKWLFVSMIIILFLILAIIYFILFPYSPQYYATTTLGQIIPLAPMH